jgi:hypothetical protein
MNRGLVSTGMPVGGCPQLGGHIYRAGGLLTIIVTPTSATATTAIALNQISSTRAREWHTGGALYVPCGTAYPRKYVGVLMPRRALIGAHRPHVTSGRS